MKALNIKSSEAYPKQKLNDIQNTQDGLAAEAKERKERIAAEAELKKKYDLAISKAKSYLLKEDLVNAQAAYNDASALKPAEVEPKNQLKIITDKLAAIARQNEIDENYEKQIHIADSLMIAENYESAKDIYKEASGIKKTETYPYSQIRYCDSQIKIAQQEEEENKKQNAINKEIENEKKFHDLIVQADKSMTAQNFKDAEQQYGEALKIKPDHEYASRRMEIAVYQFDLSKKVSKNKDVAKNNEPSGNEKSRGKNDPDMASVIPQKQTASPYQFQADPIPYSTEELKTKYPDIDFKLLPPDQPFNEEAVDDSKENTQTYIQVLNDKPRLDIDDKSHKIKLTCQGLNFEDRSVYVKLLIQNNSDNDFLTGSMMLTWTRRSGAHIKLFPLYLFPSSLPIVKPGFEAVIIYVCKSYNIGDDEKLKFELNDRMNKIKLSLSFKGSVYNEESMR